MQQLVQNLQRAYQMRIEKLEWMSIATKEKALEKLSTFRAKIGYPDRWRDYSKLEIRDDSLWDNMVRVAEFQDRFWLEKIGGPNDPTLWYMNAHEVNAYYDPSTNEICFPAGILQYPFFDMNADDAFNYGAIGSTIGHMGLMTPDANLTAMATCAIGGRRTMARALTHGQTSCANSLTIFWWRQTRMQTANSHWAKIWPITAALQSRSPRTRILPHPPQPMNTA